MKKPVSLILLFLIVLACLSAEILMTKDPGYLDLAHCGEAPGPEFLFGTDPLGRDIFSGIWYGGRISLTIGFLASALAAVIGVVYGTVSALAPRWVDGMMMRLQEMVLSIPSLLLVLFFQAILGDATPLSLALVIGVTLWPPIAGVVRTEVRQLRTSGYVLAAKAMGCSFPHILLRHLAPNFIASISFLVVMNVGSAIAMESTLSFLGMGLPLEVISWGSMLSLAQKGMTSGGWWVILIPGGFLITVLMCLAELGNELRKGANARDLRD